MRRAAAFPARSAMFSVGLVSVAGQTQGGRSSNFQTDNNGACAAMAGVTPAPARLDTGAALNGAADKMSKADLEKNLTDHINEHHGNRGTCLRVNSMVPPSGGGK